MNQDAEQMSDDSLQTHPLYATDRDEVDALLGHQGDPGPEHLTTAGINKKNELKT